MSQLGMMAVLAAMTGLVTAAFVWLGGALLENLRVMRANGAVDASEGDAED